jgi:NADPH2:quinone reductase
MKAILLRRPGGPSALEYMDMPTPVPRDGEVLVRADTIGVSMPEVLVRKGVYAWMPPLPAIPGIEMSGMVVGHGRNVAGPAIGQPVFVSARDLPIRAGCYAEYIAVPANAAYPLPPGRSLEARRHAFPPIKSPITCCIRPRTGSRQSRSSSTPRQAVSAAP